MGYALPITVAMTDMECGKCGIQFSVPETWRAEKQRSGDIWYCPNGHERVYAESDTAKAKRELFEEKTRHRATLTRLNQTTQEKEKALDALGKLKRRTAAGVCPCCHRTFQQLARHMKTKHKDELARSEDGR